MVGTPPISQSDVCPDSASLPVPGQLLAAQTPAFLLPRLRGQDGNRNSHKCSVCLSPSLPPIASLPFLWTNRACEEMATPPLRNIWANVSQQPPVISTQDSPQRVPWNASTGFPKQKPDQLSERPQHAYISKLKAIKSPAVNKPVNII